MSIKDTALFQRLRFRARAAKYSWRVDPSEIAFLRLHPLEEFEVAVHQPERLLSTPNHPGYANNFLFMDTKRERAILRRYGVAST